MFSILSLFAFQLLPLKTYIRIPYKAQDSQLNQNIYSKINIHCFPESQI